MEWITTLTHGIPKIQSSRTVKNTFYLLVIVFQTFMSSSCQQDSRPPTYFQQIPSAGQPGEPGNSKRFICESRSNPPAIYSWLKNGQPVNSSTPGYLKLTSINKNSSGIYQCVARNSLGALLSPKTHFQVAYMEPLPASATAAVTKSVELGFAIVLELPPIDSYPAPSIEWKEGFQTISVDGQRHYVTLDNNLVLLAVDTTDNGKQYRASIRNSFSDHYMDSRQFTIQVTNLGGSPNSVTPSFVVRPKNTVALGEPDTVATFECVPNAQPIEHLGIQWYKKVDEAFIRLSSDGLKYIIAATSRRLTIKAVSPSDAGEYKCEASVNNAGSVNTIFETANLTVQVPPSFIIGTNNGFRTEETDFSSRVELSCEARGLPPPNITWYFNSRELSTLGSSRHTAHDNGHLVIENVELNDAGIYQCFIHNNGKILVEEFFTTWLIVHSSPPIMEVAPQNMTIIQDDDARLPCQTRGAPRPSITWVREGPAGVENITSQGRFQIFESGELLIARALPGDTGLYTCTATNSMGSVSGKASLKVLVKTQITEPPQDKRVIKGSSTVFHCRVSRDDSVQVTWQWYHIDGSQTLLPTTGDEHHISLVGNNHKGIYRCVVSSVGGNFTAQATLEVIELPYQPTITSVQLSAGENPRSVLITWTPPFDGNDPIQQYKLQYRIVTGNDPLQENDGWLNLPDDIPASARTHTVNGLRPAQNYQFRLSSVNGVGEGAPSLAKPIPYITLPQEPPSGPPIGVTGSARSSRSIMMQWQEPDETVWNGQLLGYVIRYKGAGYSDAFYRNYTVNDWKITSHELVNLLVFTPYEISIAAHNERGVGVYSASVFIRTEEGKPTAPPTAVETMALNSTAVNVSWFPPDPQKINGVNQGYKIRATRLNTAQPEVVYMSVAPDTSNPYEQQWAVLGNLRKYTEYDIVIVCYTTPGDGPASNPPSTIRTEEDIPGPVSLLVFEDVRDTSMIVKWTPPAAINGILTGYILYYEEKNVTGTRVPVPQGPADLQDTIQGLNPVTMYTISVEAKTQKGSGPLKSADIKSGVPPELPTAPQNLGISDIQARSVVVQFRPGYNGKTSITKWIAEALELGELNWTEVYNVSAPDATSITVQNLRPYTVYQVRLKAENIVGASGPSDPSRSFQTIQSAPDTPPGNVTVRAINATAVRISWTPLATKDWNGDPKGYKILFKPKDIDTFQTHTLHNINLDSFILTGLEEWTEYQVKMLAFNEVADSAYSPISVERTREAVPSAGPADVVAVPSSSTSINVTWGDVPLFDRNGMIQGYKIRYYSREENIADALGDVPGNGSHSHLIPDLRKFVRYQVQVLAYTVMGDGVLSQPEVSVTTLEDLPGPPIIIYFPDVTYSLAQIVWEPPIEPNGLITGYKVGYRERNQTESASIVNDTLSATTQEYTVTGLRRMTYYIFSVAAKTRLGWGENASVLVLTMINRDRPESPTKPIIGSSQVSARQVTISWTPQGDGYGPLRNYTIQYKPQHGDWATVHDVVTPDVTSYTVPGLRPNTWYQFRVSATNDIGTSPYSPPSDEVQTLQDKPDGAPRHLAVRPLTVTSIKVNWEQPESGTWNGAPKGYVVQYRQAELPSYQEKTLNFTLHETVLADLVQFVNYEVRVLAYNDKGRGPPSTPATIYVGEAAPNAPPQNIVVTPVSSSELKVMWDPPPPENQNGMLSGYKVSFWPMLAGNASVIPPRIVVEREVSLKDLQIFTDYSVVVLAYNLAGDGPNSSLVSSKTKEDLPSEPRNLHFKNITLDSVNVTWSPPLYPNGLNIMYDVIYYQQHPSHGIITVQVTLPEAYHHANNLHENGTYVFSVKARNGEGAGNATNGSVTIGPQKYSPQPPTELKLSPDQDSVSLSWTNGNSEKEPILGFNIQVKEEKEDSNWLLIAKKNSADPIALISLNQLKGDTDYRFRVIAFNSYGISYPSAPSSIYTTKGTVNGPASSGVTKEKEFYSQWWFLVIAALTGVIIILVVVTLLCLVSKRGKRKSENARKMATVTIQPQQEPEEGGFSSIEMNHHRRSTNMRNGTLGRNTLTRSAPRPSPASVTYSEDDYKSPIPDDNSSSLEEKPSELGDSTEPSDEESEPESEQAPSPPKFNNPYVNAPVRQSWYHQSPSNAYSYTDSEQESSHYAVGLNSGQLMVNNTAGSRAPLPGFSSFV